MQIDSGCREPMHSFVASGGCLSCFGKKGTKEADPGRR